RIAGHQGRSVVRRKVLSAGKSEMNQSSDLPRTVGRGVLTAPGAASERDLVNSGASPRRAGDSAPYPQIFRSVSVLFVCLFLLLSPHTTFAANKSAKQKSDPGDALFATNA